MHSYSIMLEASTYHKLDSRQSRKGLFSSCLCLLGDSPFSIRLQRHLHRLLCGCQAEKIWTWSCVDGIVNRNGWRHCRHSIIGRRSKLRQECRAIVSWRQQIGIQVMVPWRQRIDLVVVAVGRCCMSSTPRRNCTIRSHCNNRRDGIQQLSTGIVDAVGW